MSWAIAGTAAGTALLGAVNASQQRNAQRKQNQMQADQAAAQMEFSPWTGVKPGTPQMQTETANPVGSALQGGLGGAMYAMANKDKLQPASSPMTDSNFQMPQMGAGGAPPMETPQVAADMQMPKMGSMYKKNPYR